MLQLFTFILSAILIIIDQITKDLAVNFLKDRPSAVLWPDVFELRYCENPGIAFSLLENQRWIFIPMTCVVMTLLIVMLLRSDLRQYKWFSLSCSLILAGGVGNLIDRVVYGYVVDFLYFRLIDFPIFNFADCCVVAGAISLFTFLLFKCKDEDFGSIRSLIFGSQKTGKEIPDDDRNEKLDNSADGEG